MHFQLIYLAGFEECIILVSEIKKKKKTLYGYSQICNTLQSTLNGLLCVTWRMHLVMFPWWAMGKLEIANWLLFGPLHVQGHEKQVGFEFSEELDVVVAGCPPHFGAKYIF